MTDYTITDGRQGKIIRCPSASGFKTRAARLAASARVGGLYNHRVGGYAVSLLAAARFERLYAAGYDASYINGLIEPPERARDNDPAPD